MPWCPKCRTEYRVMGTCPRCGAQLADGLRPFAWADQIAVAAALSVGMTIGGLVVLAAAGSLIQLLPGGWLATTIAASGVTVAAFTAVAFRIGRMLAQRLTPVWTAMGWMIGSGAIFWFLASLILRNGHITPYGIMAGVILVFLIPSTGATATIYGMKLSRTDWRRFLVPFVVLTIVGAGALCYWLTLPPPDWMD